jgi:exonuclease SbcC
MSAAVLRLEAPLNDARRGAQLNRERLLARAKALASEAGAGAQGRELVAKVRELQAEWRHHAAALPLARALENALWTRFKADIDATFSARDAGFSARDAELKAHGAERAALIERLAAVAADTPPAELKRALAEAEAKWQRVGPAPRSDAAALESRFRSARDNVRQFLVDRAQRDWHATCDALMAKLALCEEFEHTGGSAQTKATLEQCWSAQPVLPSLWEQEVARRAGLIQVAHGGGSRITASADDLLLQLEAAFQLDSPPAFQAARRELKLQAMKAALEGRQTAASAPLAPDQLLAAALGRTALDDPQRERLGKVIAAVRDRGPTSAG